MDAVLTMVVSDPLADIQILLSVAGAVGFIIFAWGFAGYILAHEDDEHEQHASVRMITGLVWMVVLFVLWEVIRYVVSLY